jgi:hypothetical protein
MDDAESMKVSCLTNPAYGTGLAGVDLLPSLELGPLTHRVDDADAPTR